MTELATYRLDEGIATITMDDGKVNVLSLDMQAQLNEALDRAESEATVVVLAGREGRFSAGFDLSVLNAGGVVACDMLRGGYELAARLLGFERPVVIACTGHAIAMASFLLVSGDYRVGADGPFKITANEVAIGLVMPRAVIEICRERLTPTHLQRAINTAEVYDPAGAVTAGWLDEIAPPGAVLDAAAAAAARMAELDARAHTVTKRRVRDDMLRRVRDAIEIDDAELRAVWA